MKTFQRVTRSLTCAAVLAFGAISAHAAFGYEGGAVKSVVSHPLPQLVILSSPRDGTIPVAMDSRSKISVSVAVDKGVPQRILFFDGSAKALPPGNPDQCNSVLNPTFTLGCLSGQQVLCSPIPVDFEDCFCTCTAQ